MTTNSIRYEATAQDRMNEVIDLFSAEQQIAAVLHCLGELNAEILKKAVILTMDNDPILKARYVKDEEPYWEVGVDAKSDVDIVVCSDTNIDHHVQRYLEKACSRSEAPMVHVRLFVGKKRQTLVIKLSHLCSDGGGMKEYIHNLARVYTYLQSGVAPDEKWRKMFEGNIRTRNHDIIFQYAGVKDQQSLLSSRQQPDVSLWSFPSDPARGRNRTKVAQRIFTQEQTTNLMKWARENKATVNDVLLASYFKVLSNQAVCAEPHTRKKMVGVTVDLRRYLPERTTGTICNASGMEMPTIEIDEDDTLLVLVQRVKKAMGQIKSKKPGLSSAAGMERMSSMKRSQVIEMYAKQYDMAKQMKMALPLMTNFGKMAEEPICFGDVEIEDGYMVPPLMYAPFFTLGVSTYQNCIALVTGFHEPETSPEEVGRFLDEMEALLLEV